MVLWTRPHLDLKEPISCADIANEVNTALLHYPSSFVLADSCYGSIALTRTFQRHQRLFCMSLNHQEVGELSRSLTDVQASVVQLKETNSSQHVSSSVSLLSSQKSRAHMTMKNNPIVVANNVTTHEFVRNVLGRGMPSPVRMYEERGRSVSRAEESILSLLRGEHHSWEVRLFHWLFFVVAHNSWRYLIHSSTEQPITLKEFVDLHVWGLLTEQQKEDSSSTSSSSHTSPTV